MNLGYQKCSAMKNLVRKNTSLIMEGQGNGEYSILMVELRRLSHEIDYIIGCFVEKRYV